jgi:glycine cleavage system H protein
MSKEISELNLPTDVRYSEDHEWARKEGENIKIGISDYAQDQLGDIVFVELPEVGSTFALGDEFGTLESVKAVSELFMPIAGEIVAINEGLEDVPEQVNSDPYGEGWMIIIKPDNDEDFGAMKDQETYLTMLKG